MKKVALPTWKLVISVIADCIGVLSYVVPFFGGITDIVYAPIYGLWIGWAYKNAPIGFLGFVEEVLPVTDVIPTATMLHLWLLHHGEDAQVRK